MAGVWAFLSCANGYFMPVTNDFLWIAGLLAGGNVGAAMVKKYGVIKQ